MQVTYPINDEKRADETLKAHTVNRSKIASVESQAHSKPASSNLRPSITLSELRAREAQQVSTKGPGALENFVSFASKLDPLRPICWTASLPSLISSLWVMESGIGKGIADLGAGLVNGNLSGIQITFLVSSFLLGIAVTSQTSEIIKKHQEGGDTFSDACEKVIGGVAGVASLGTSAVAGLHALTGGSEQLSSFTSAQFALGLLVIGSILLFRADPGH